MWQTTGMRLATPTSSHAAILLHECPSGEGEVWGGEGSCSNTPSYFTAHSPPQTASDGAQVQQEAAASRGNVLYQADHLKITSEGLISLALCQLPGIALGFFGIMKAFMTHGLATQAVKDSLR